MADLLQRMEKEPDKMVEIMADVKSLEDEFKPLETLMNEFEDIAKATENGKVVMDDEEWGNALKKELGLPDDM